MMTTTNNDKYKERARLAFNIFKTFSTCIGAISFKNGKAVLVLDDVSNRLNFNSETKVILFILTSAGVLYTLGNSRLPAFWKTFSEKEILLQTSSQ